MSTIDEVLEGALPEGFPAPETRKGEVLQRLAEYGVHGATDNELITSFEGHMTASTVRPRRIELEGEGFVAAAGYKRANSQVWLLSATARGALNPSFSTKDGARLGALDGARRAELDAGQAGGLARVRLGLAQLVRLGRRAAREEGVDLEELLTPEAKLDGTVCIPQSCVLAGPGLTNSGAAVITAELGSGGLRISFTIGAPDDASDPDEADLRRRTRAQLRSMGTRLQIPVQVLLVDGWELGRTSNSKVSEESSFESWLGAAVDTEDAAVFLSRSWATAELDGLGFDVGAHIQTLARTLAPVILHLSQGSTDPVQDLMDALYWPRPRVQALVDLAGRSRQLLFAGPPGTGKTYAARALARALAGEGFARVMQFHPSYAYEDFVEGIRPVLSGEGSAPDDAKGLGYVLRRGVLRDVAREAVDRQGEPVFLIIDEINRANLPRVLGELLFSLEYRGPGNEVVLPYSGDLFTLPPNLWIIGTMNTADRSVALIDAAMRRRFKQVRFPVDYGALAAWHAARTNAAIGHEACTRLKRLNELLAELLDEDRLVGHSYLMRDDLEVIGWETVWTEDFEPVLHDHLLGQLDELDDLQKAFLGPVAS